jgi:hypothetical protein
MPQKNARWNVHLWNFFGSRKFLCLWFRSRSWIAKWDSFVYDQMISRVQGVFANIFKSLCFPNFWCSRIFLLLSSVLSSSFILQKSCSETEKATMAKVYVKKIKSLHFLLKVQICTLNKQIFGLLQWSSAFLFLRWMCTRRFWCCHSKHHLHGGGACICKCLSDSALLRWFSFCTIRLASSGPAELVSLASFAILVSLLQLASFC